MYDISKILNNIGMNYALCTIYIFFIFENLKFFISSSSKLFHIYSRNSSIGHDITCV